MQRRMLAVASATTITLIFSLLPSADATYTDVVDTVTQAERHAGVDNTLSATMVPSGDAVVSQSGDVVLENTNGQAAIVADTDEGESRMLLEGSTPDLRAENGLGLVSPRDVPSTSFSISPTSEGSVRVHSVLENKDAPERIDYSFPDVDFIEIDDTDGIAYLFSFDESGVEANITGVVDVPWAVDAQGTEVPTHFEADGNTLTQVVDHQQGDYAYPVIADPDWWSKAKAWFSSASKFIKSKAKGAANWLRSSYGWLKGKTWATVKWVKKRGGKLAKFAAKKFGPGVAVLCLTGGAWRWYRSDASGWVRVGDAVIGCFG